MSFYLSSELIFIYVLILPEEQTGEDWKTFQKTELFRKSRELDIKFSHFHLAFEWSSSSSSSSSSYICHGVGPLVDPFRSHASRSLFKGLP
jgi:hypothetical protein